MTLSPTDTFQKWNPATGEYQPVRGVILYRVTVGICLFFEWETGDSYRVGTRDLKPSFELIPRASGNGEGK